MALFKVYNGAMPTTSQFAAVATGTALKTLLQFKPSATLPFRITEWGISFDGASAAAGIQCELIETDIAATVTAFVANDIHKIDDAALLCGDPTTNLIQVGTAASGYTASAEGSITAVRIIDDLFIQPTGAGFIQLPLGDEGTIQVSKFARVRVKASASVNAITWMKVRSG